MSPRKIMLSAAGGAISATFGRFVLNNMSTVNGVGMIDRLLPEPLSSWWMWAIVGAAWGVRRNMRREKMREEYLVNVCDWSEQHDFEFYEQIDRDDLGSLQQLNVFQDWYRASNYLVGRLADSRVEMVDYTSISKGGESDSYEHQTVVLLPEKGFSLPEFELHTSRWHIRFFQFMGGRGMRFVPGIELSRGDANTVSQFNGHYALFPTSLRDLMESKQREQQVSLSIVEGIRSLFSLDLLRYFATHPGWCIESKNGHLAIWKPGTIVPLAERRGLLEEVKAIRDALFRASQTPVTAGLELSASNVRRVPARNGCLLFGCIAVGFFSSGFFATFFWMVWAQRNLDWPLVTMLVWFVFIFGGALAGGFVFFACMSIANKISPRK